MGLGKLTWTRRHFLGAAAGYGVILAGGIRVPGGPWVALAQGSTREDLEDLVRESPVARYWISAARAAAGDCSACHAAGTLAPDARPDHARDIIQCQLCARNCMLADGERGMCRARMHVHGELKSLVYGRPLSVHVDPIEKKPFYHFLPGSAAYSLSTSGCPLRCKFCQNWEISQCRPEDYRQRPVTAARIAQTAVERDAPIIAFTYNEPTVFTEYLSDIARAARPLGRRTALVSCGFMNEAPLQEMCEVLDAIKIDLKGCDENFYRDVCGAALQPVLRSIRQVAQSGRHLEIVNLVVPTLNDSDRMLHMLAQWIVGEIGPDVPVHFTRFHPDYQLRHLPPTPVATLERARAIAMDAGVHFAYVGNVPGHPGNHTQCPRCAAIVIERDGFFVTDVRLRNGRCAACAQAIPGVWS